jgi:hypothetical protein
VDALVHDKLEVSGLVGIYALISRSYLNMLIKQKGLTEYCRICRICPDSSLNNNRHFSS